MTTTPCDAVDFSRSFLTFRVDVQKKPPRTVTHKPPFTVNNARIQLDCWLQVVDRQSGARQEFVLGASCKTERVGVPEGIWTEPNADFIPILSEQRFLNLKTYDYVGRPVPYWPPELGLQPERQSGLVDEAFDRLQIDVRRVAAERLDDCDAIVEAVFRGAPLVARNEWRHEQYDVAVEYPVKTMNASERDKIYQTDTGPVLLPDLTRPWDQIIAGLELAYVAFNAPDWSEWLIRAPTPLPTGPSVYHYNRVLRMTTQNQLFALTGG